MFLSLDGTFWIQLINFANFFAILGVVFLRPVGEAIRKRRDYIDGVRSGFERYSAETRNLRAEANAKRTAARREAEETLAKVRVAAESEATVLAATFMDRANAIAKDARATVDAELRSARDREGELAKTLAEQLLDRALGGAR